MAKREFVRRVIQDGVSLWRVLSFACGGGNQHI
jgi:hypothetical protein